MAIKDRNINYYRIPSLNNDIVPETLLTSDIELVASNLTTLNTYYLDEDISIDGKYLTLEQIKEYEEYLNENKQNLSFHSATNPDYDFREYYEW